MPDYYPFWPFKFKRPQSAPAPIRVPPDFPNAPTPPPQTSKPKTQDPPPVEPYAPGVPSPRVKPEPGLPIDIRRWFYNEPGFQTYGSFFAHWGGWVTAAHVLTEAGGKLPDFARSIGENWPGGLDAALLDCDLPADKPAAPVAGQDVICIGFPAGSDVAARRKGKVYIRRSDLSWIAHIITPDEPVVSGMSGGVVLDAKTNTPIGIIITRNSPADLNNDRDPDESCDFTALSDVWTAAAGNLPTT